MFAVIIIISILSLLLLKFTEIGISGIIVPQILSQAVFNLWYWPYKANKEMNLTMGQLFLLGVKNFAQKFSE